MSYLPMPLSAQGEELEDSGGWAAQSAALASPEQQQGGWKGAGACPHQQGGEAGTLHQDRLQVHHHGADPGNLFFFFFQVWWHAATLLIYFYINRAVMQYLYILLAEYHSCLHPLGRGPPLGVPSRDSNSGLPYSKPTRYNLSHTAPNLGYEKLP